MQGKMISYCSVFAKLHVRELSSIGGVATEAAMMSIIVWPGLERIGVAGTGASSRSPGMCARHEDRVFLRKASSPDPATRCQVLPRWSSHALRCTWRWLPNCHSNRRGGWPGLERLREVPECGLHVKAGSSFAEPQSRLGRPIMRCVLCDPMD